MEAAFSTSPMNVLQELRWTGVAPDLIEKSRQGDVNIQSFHEFLKHGKKLSAGAKQGVLLAPTGPYRSVISAIATQTGLLPWWDAYPALGLPLDPTYTEAFVDRLAAEGREIFLLVPRGFRGDVHKGSFTLNDFDEILRKFDKLRGHVHFVLGFENTFPLDYKRRLTTEQVVEEGYEDRVMNYFLAKYQEWLIELGPKIHHYSVANQFTSSSYPLIYDQALELLSAHRENRALHSHYMPHGKVRILDLGGGTGLIARQLTADDPERLVEIYDSSPVMLEVAKAKGVPETRLHLNSVTKLPGADESADGAVSNNVIYLLTPVEIEASFQFAFSSLSRSDKKI
jgi:hypothetical protein